MNYLAVVWTILASAAFTAVFGFQTSPTPQSAGVIQQRMQTTDYDLIKQKNSPKNEELKQAEENKRLITVYVDPLYRNPTAADLSSVAIDPAIRSIFSSFLSRPNSGIFKITPDLGCPESPGVVSDDRECLKYPFPGAGNAYSFRQANYRARTLADLTFSGAKFYAPGTFTQGIIVKLGNVPIEDIGLRSNGMGYLASFTPSGEFTNVSGAAKQFEVGVDSDGFRYASSVPVEMNMTYAIRSVAYRGSVTRVFQGAVYNELDYDKRRDVIVLFRTVGFDESGVLTIIWRELRNVESPKLKSQK